MLAVTDILSVKDIWRDLCHPKGKKYYFYNPFLKNLTTTNKHVSKHSQEDFRKQVG